MYDYQKKRRGKCQNLNLKYPKVNAACEVRDIFNDVPNFQEKFDIVFIDAAHTREHGDGILSIIKNHMSENWIVFSHDVGYNRERDEIQTKYSEHEAYLEAKLPYFLTGKFKTYSRFGAEQPHKVKEWLVSKALMDEVAFPKDSAYSMILSNYLKFK